ncbi:T-cell surface glycoprotein CD3 zeta chain-like isoform X2 [Paramormyrops kingsleyae]|nr:T-cell surface glycoprotein CD3 zeta chain-like isoform X2 [Paramormyrops kingsleyae]XP_023690250.1 T-cell surface glycoprotein CD3 zeta chain-like isoform X2 [Paramormyrops kingsleyae]XP_023690258.1 T-cell surface glycoprotein CD3 zeta chain-like isoform X2 [Paramormyrops kingsleyae]XP_023690264.1 T-cell surface glycoprotein CD3 zeta chain-like isoform X2 [Paramormyrops kingsleyae]XP_023690271.1 T-cell surface glycoprotein CD3 zeta chain-like isoform X2 [Paramormyrops kingsleyae]
MNITDPAICYILDGLLLLYSIVMTALFFRAKFGNQSTSKEEGIYSDLNRAPDTYDQLRGPNDPESGTVQRQRPGNDGVYTPLQKKDEDTYKQITVNRERRRNKTEQVYQGLTGATRDTYDALQMQPMLPPR